MRDATELRRALLELDGRSYPAYKSIKGTWSLEGFQLSLDHVQGDPFAAPSRLRVQIPADVAELDPWLLLTPARRWGVAAALARAFSDAARRHPSGSGSGKSGEVAMASPGQLVLPQNAVQISQGGGVEARFTAGLPARGRRILGRAGADLLLDAVPRIVRDTLLAAAHSPDDLRAAAAVNEDADALRDQLAGRGLVGFVADGALLPRRSGVDDRPMDRARATPFASPDSLALTLEAPHAGPVRGMGVPAGVTLVVGGGFHGKSTLLRALEAGVYNHAPGDGRERVVTRFDAVKIRAEDGRAAHAVDIADFIGDLPDGQATRAFTTANASGSTSMAAGLVEALEGGAGALLIDEDTAATNFLIRDRRMQALVPSGSEPITPLVDRVRELYEELGVSTVLVLGGSGDYLDVADTVVGMDRFSARDLTAAAREVAAKHPTGRTVPGLSPLRRPRERTAERSSLPAGRRGRELRVKTGDGRSLRVGSESLSLAAVEQLLLPSQLRCVATVLEALARRPERLDRPLPRLLADLEAEMWASGPDTVDARKTGGLAAVRRFELASALNRLRSLRIRTP